MLFATDDMGRTVLHMTARAYKPQILEEILKWAKEKLTSQEVNKFLLATDDEGRTVFHLTAETEKLKILQEILEWAKEKITTE